MHIATATEADCRQWLHGQGPLAANMQCSRCYTPMEEKDYGRVLDGKIRRCPPKQCHATLSLRKGSFFEHSNLPLTKLTDIIYYLVDGDQQRWGTEAEYQVTFLLFLRIAYSLRCDLLDYCFYTTIDVCCVQLGVNGKIVTDWFNFVRRLLGGNASQPRPDRRTRHHRRDRRIVAKAKPGNIHGRPVPQQWVFGGVQLGTDRFFMELV